MSLRKPKSLIIRHDNEESSGEEVIEKAPVRNRKSKKSRKKIKINQGMDEEDEPLGDVEFQLKPNKRGISLPLFDNLEDDKEFGAFNDTGELRKQVESQRVPIEEIVSIVDDTDKSEYIPSHEEYISVVLPEEESKEDTDSEMDLIDDGRLPLTERETKMQKKLHDLEIKDTLYDAELSQGEDLDDWESSKMRHGAMMDSKNTVIQDRFPKMNLLENETFEDQLKVLDDSITVLENQRLQRLTELDRLKAQRQNYEHELAKLSAEVSNLS